MSISYLRPLNELSYPAKTAAFSLTAASTGTWGAAATGVLVWADAACYVAVGDGVTATTSSTPVPPNTPLAFSVPSGSVAWRVSAIGISGSGNIYCKPMTE